MKMNKKEFSKMIAEGNYKIEEEEHCSCNFDWKIINYELTCDVDHLDCWNGVVMYNKNDEPIMENTLLTGLQEVECLGIENLYEFLEEEHPQILEEMSFNKHKKNEEHEKRKLESLIEWLEESEYDMYIDPCRGFANEYTCVLAERYAETHDDLIKVDAQKWATKYLYEGDAALQAFVGFNILYE